MRKETDQSNLSNNSKVIEKNTTKEKLADIEQVKQTVQSSEVFDDTWAELSQDWQSQPYEKVDIKALLAQTRKRTFWAKFLLSLNILATISFIVVVIILWISDSQDTATMTYLIFGAVGSIIFVYYEINIRLNAWQQISVSPELAVKNAIKGVESSIQYIRLTKFSCWFLIPAGSWYVIEMAKQADKPIWLGLILMNGAVAVMWGITHCFHRKRNAELAQLKLSLNE